MEESSSDEDGDHESLDEMIAYSLHYRDKIGSQFVAARAAIEDECEWRKW